MNTFDEISGKISEFLNVISAVWMFSLAILILLDVTARGVFGVPLLGIPELIANSPALLLDEPEYSALFFKVCVVGGSSKGQNGGTKGSSEGTRGR